VIVQQFILRLQSPQVGFSPADAAWAYSSFISVILMALLLRLGSAVSRSSAKSA
jgi:hypothetical protein